MKAHIGCSGYNYKDWRGKFYPEKMPQRRWFDYYSSIFDTVEINNTFYKFPREKGLNNWRETAENDFQFTLKGHRYITHRKKLKDIAENVKQFEDLARLLKRNLGCILWQLPPNLKRNDEKLVQFCKDMDPAFKNVLEFRHESWYDKEVYEILKEHNVSFCSISSPEHPDDMIVTNDIGYVRFHGEAKDWYDYLYSEKELMEWYTKIKNSGAKEVYIYFNNDIHTNAPENARQLKELFKKGI